MSYLLAAELLEKVAKKKRNKKYNPNKINQKADANPKAVGPASKPNPTPAVTKYSKIPQGMSLGKKLAIGAGVTAAAGGTAALVHKIRNRDK